MRRADELAHELAGALRAYVDTPGRARPHVERWLRKKLEEYEVEVFGRVVPMGEERDVGVVEPLAEAKP